ncbi:histidine phosphatase family protein [Streptomyces lunaelactis]|uniref:SixA phosphatase family protein n=1 Tax=Streptomyces lunaelactis TaxID=1535768 RepID=UPI0015851D4E|nr:histidine phosphatase family protein [Streptomyces lunaelactis]NUK55354.1 histidine phosphatase family protein [Streptomyces lunaelactis]NUK69035.1 histidine phosphatase family protein [Streptomyces lunaelactis]NUK77826.1 histidine phosphatase family protein [Streptomyces lunaelactis]
MSPLRRLVVLRHAKSAWPEGVADHARPLGPRGLRDAPAVGRWLATADCLPDLVLCSTARRARQTWELAAAELGSIPPVRFERRVYAADEQQLIDAVHEVPVEMETLLLIGHNPGLQDLILLLAGETLGDALQRTRTKFPTSAVAVLTWRGTWSALAPGTALLTDLAVPRGLKK